VSRRQIRKPIRCVVERERERERPKGARKSKDPHVDETCWRKVEASKKEKEEEKEIDTFDAFVYACVSRDA